MDIVMSGYFYYIGLKFALKIGNCKFHCKWDSKTTQNQTTPNMMANIIMNDTYSLYRWPEEEINESYQVGNKNISQFQV